MQSTKQSSNHHARFLVDDLSRLVSHTSKHLAYSINEGSKVEDMTSLNHKHVARGLRWRPDGEHYLQKHRDSCTAQSNNRISMYLKVTKSVLDVPSGLSCLVRKHPFVPLLTMNTHKQHSVQQQ